MSGLLPGGVSYDDALRMHRHNLLLEKIVDRMLNLKIDPERFEILKKDIYTMTDGTFC